MATDLEGPECIAVLDLQKSNYGDYYELITKIFVRGMFGNNYSKNKDLMKKHTGDVFTRQPNNYKDVLYFDTSMDDVKAKERLECLFSEFIVPFTNKTVTRAGIKELVKQEKIFLLPAVKEKLV